MYMKKLFDSNSSTPKVIGVKVMYAGPKQKFSTRVVTMGLSEGWLKINGRQLTIHGIDGILIYRIDRFPGRYHTPVGDEHIHYHDCMRME